MQKQNTRLTRRDALTALALGLLIAVSYFPALQGGFIWDDVVFTEEQVIQKGSGLRSIWFSPGDIQNEGHYWPVVYTTFWLEHKLWGLAPFGYHLVNVLLHVVNCLLVWRLMGRLAVPGAWAIAAVFAVHPLHVESVAWIIERKDLLSTLFYLTAVLTWIRFVEEPRWGRYCLALGLFTAGLLSKSMVVTLPATLLIWHWWQRDRVTSTDWLRLAPFFAVGLGITFADFSFYVSRETLALGYSFVERVLIASHALWFYVGKLLWPTDLAVIYPFWDIRIGAPLAWAYVVAAVAVAALLWFGRHRLGRGPLAGVLFFVVTLSPVLGFVDYGYMQFSFVADRFQYLAGIGVLAVLIGGAVHGANTLPGTLKMGATSLLVVVLALLGTLTWQQASIYRDDVTFFNHVVSLNPDARDAYLNLSSALLKADRLEEGLAASRIAVEKRPDSANAYSNIGRALLSMERFEEAEAHLSHALEFDPRNKTALQNMAELLRKQGHYKKAIEWFRKVVAKDHTNVLAHAGMGTSLFALKQYEEAVESMEKALALQPDSPKVRHLHVFAGRALQALGRLEAAEQHFRRLAEIDPRDSGVLVDLANLRMKQQRFEEADRHLRRAQELSSRDPVILHTIAETLRKQGRDEKAMESYRATLDIDPEFAPAYAGLGIALFKLERHEEAVERLSEALRLQPDLPVASKLHVFLGRAHQSLGQPEAAVEHHERAVAINPRNTDALDRLAMIRFGQKQYEKALDLYQKLAEINPDGPQTYANMGVTLYHLGRPKDALKSFARALVLNPDLAMAKTGAEHMRKIISQDGQ